MDVEQLEIGEAMNADSGQIARRKIESVRPNAASADEGCR
jgi:hypothetical protein